MATAKLKVVNLTPTGVETLWYHSLTSGMVVLKDNSLKGVIAFITRFVLEEQPH